MLGDIHARMVSSTRSFCLFAAPPRGQSCPNQWALPVCWWWRDALNCWTEQASCHGIILRHVSPCSTACLCMSYAMSMFVMKHLRQHAEARTHAYVNRHEHSRCMKTVPQSRSPLPEVPLCLAITQTQGLLEAEVAPRLASSTSH